MLLLLRMLPRVLVNVLEEEGLEYVAGYDGDEDDDGPQPAILRPRPRRRDSIH